MQTAFGRVMEDISKAYQALAERVDELGRQDTYWGKLDLSGYTLAITNNVSLGNVTIDDGTLDLNNHTLSLASDLTFNPGVTGRLAQYIAVDTLDESTLAKAGGGVLTLSAASAYTLTVASSGTLDLNGGTLSLPIPIAQGGTGATTASAARTALGTNDAANITTGTLAPARMGSGTANASTLLFGDGTWNTLAAADIPALDASKITTGTLAAARLGASPSAAYTLHGDSTWSLVSLSAEVTGTLPIANGGTGATTQSAALTSLGAAAASHTHNYVTYGSATAAQLAIWGTATGIFGDSGLTYNISTNVLTSTGGFNSGGGVWTFGAYTVGVLSAVGYLNVTVGGTARRILIG